MPDMNQMFGAMNDPEALKLMLMQPVPAAEPGAEKPVLSPYSDEELLEMWEDMRKESFEGRWVFERQWQRNILYVLGRQWIDYNSRQGGWRDKRMAQWIPRPVTNKCKETVQSIRAMFTSIKLGVNVRPNGSDPANVAAAAVSDELAPVLHEDHDMDTVLTEDDFWLLVTGNCFLHTFVDYDIKHGVIEVAEEQCLACGNVVPSSEIAGPQPVCPECGGTEFGPAMDEMTGEPKVTRLPKGKPITIPLSPLELAFPNHYPRFSELPYVIRLRWRPKSYFKGNPALQALMEKISWQKAPSDQSLQLFKALANHNDLGVAPAYLSDGVATTSNEDGIPEYEVWVKPNMDYPEGLVFRVYGDKNPVIAHLEETESIPGPLPYRDAEGNPLFTFAHAGYEHVGGRILASGPLDQIIQKQDQLNQLDSMILLIIQRMSNPVWLEPKGSEVERLTGMPGLVVKYNALIGNGVKPERISGEGPHNSLFVIREQYLKDIEELAGTFDIVKGAKPTGVEAFSALQLLVERSQARFAGVFSARGTLYRNWFKFALELEREFGPEERIKATHTPARTWAFQNFKRTQLQGSVSVVVEDGTNAPKTTLGMRAALEHANTLQMLNMADPDQRYEGLKLFGLTRLAPSLDINVQSALKKQEAFELWAVNPQNVVVALAQAEQAFAQWQVEAASNFDPMTGEPLIPPPSVLDGTPLRWLDWYDPEIHRQEFIKWANGDRVQPLLEVQGVEALLKQHLTEIDQAIIKKAQQLAMRQMAMMPPPPQTGGSMSNSNRESGENNEPRGNGEGAQNQGPR
jgi:hypothetical protein